MELPREQKDFSLKRERARTIDASMNYIADRSWYLLRHTDPLISKESFENEVVTLRLLSHLIQLNMNPVYANINHILYAFLLFDFQDRKRAYEDDIFHRQEH